MAFDDAAAYRRFMGRFSEPLAGLLCDAAGVRADGRVLDVGCGAGALTAELVHRLGPAAVAAVDPSPAFVAATAAAHPGVDVRVAGAEELPFPDDAFDAALAELVVQFMTDPVAGLAEMARVVRPGGQVAACTWDSAAGPLTTFWRAVDELGQGGGDRLRPGGAEGELAALLTEAGLGAVWSGRLTVSAAYADVGDWWTSYTLGVGPPGDHVAGLDDTARERLRARCAELLPAGPFEVTAAAWVAGGTAG